MTVLTELVAKISTDASELKKGLSDAEGATEKSSQKMGESLKKVGMAMAASGAVITAAMGFMGKAAIDEEINIKRLATTMKNTGTAYDDVKDSLEALIATTQRKTGVADDEQRNILNRLILVTNDYGKALELLPTVLDLAAAGEMDATTAATYLGKAYLELEQGADEVSVRFGQASLKFKDMADIQTRVAGSAESLVNPLSVLKASIGDVAEMIGANLIPMIKGAVDKIVDIAIKVQEWAAEHPALAKTLTIVGLAVGVILTVVGGLILIMPTIISLVAAFGVVFHAALGPIGWISLAIAGLITAGILLWKNWDKVVHFFQDAWSNIKNAVLHGVDFVLGLLEKFVGWIPGLGDKIRGLRNTISDIIDANKIERDSRDAQRALAEVGEAYADTAEIIEQNTDATEEQTTGLWDNIEALEEQKKALEEQAKAYERLLEKAEDATKQFQYERSEAGRLRITTNDVTNALITQGWTTSQLADLWEDLGDDVRYANLYLAGAGLTIQNITDILGLQSDAIEDTTAKYNIMAKAAESAAEKIQRLTGFAPGGVSPTWPVSGEQLAPQAALWAEVLDLRSQGKWGEAEALLPAVRSGMQSLYGYADGGIVPGSIGQPQLAMVHGGETITPAGESGGITVNISGPLFMEREDQMNQLVDKIRKGIQRQDRLRFGGAYSGG